MLTISSTLSADREPLYQAQSYEQDRRRDSYRGVGWQKTDSKSREPHHQERENQHGLTTDLVPQVAEDHTAQRPGQETYRKGSERGESARQRLKRRKEERPENQRGRASIDKVIVLLDSGAYSACYRYSPDRRDLSKIFAANLIHACLPPSFPSRTFAAC